MRYGTSYCEVGSLFGLTAADLTDEQLKKINLDKLLEFADTDPRADKIISEQMKTWEDIRMHFSGLGEKTVDNMPHTYQKYNQFVSANSVPTDGWYRRDNFIFWKLLNDDNKVMECKRWLKGDKNAFDATGMDYSWLYNVYPRLAKKVTEKILCIPRHEYLRELKFKVLIPALPEPELLKHLPTIYGEGRPFSFYLTSNKFTPAKEKEALLRAMSGKNLPSMDIILDKSILVKIPPVTRLKLLESILFNMYDGKAIFTDIKTPDDLNSLLFVTSVKYNGRVQKVVDKFKKIYIQDKV